MTWLSFLLLAGLLFIAGGLFCFFQSTRIVSKFETMNDVPTLNSFYNSCQNVSFSDGKQLSLRRKAAKAWCIVDGIRFEEGNEITTLDGCENCACENGESVSLPCVLEKNGLASETGFTI